MIQETLIGPLDRKVDHSIDRNYVVVVLALSSVPSGLFMVKYDGFFRIKNKIKIISKSSRR